MSEMHSPSRRGDYGAGYQTRQSKSKSNAHFSTTRESRKFSQTLGVTKSRSISNALGDSVEQEKYLNKAIRVIFKTADFKQLNADALEACEVIGVRPETLQLKTVEQFAGDPKEPAELAQVRLAHYLNKRK
jgi:hypothetical protein